MKTNVKNNNFFCFCTCQHKCQIRYQNYHFITGLEFLSYPCTIESSLHLWHSRLRRYPTEALAPPTSFYCMASREIDAMPMSLFTSLLTFFRYWNEYEMNMQVCCCIITHCFMIHLNLTWRHSNSNFYNRILLHMKKRTFIWHQMFAVLTYFSCKSTKSTFYLRISL